MCDGKRENKTNTEKERKLNAARKNVLVREGEREEGEEGRERGRRGGR